MDNIYSDQYNEYVGAEGGLFVAKEFRLSRSTYLLLALTQQVGTLRNSCNADPKKVLMHKLGWPSSFNRPKLFSRCTFFFKAFLDWMSPHWAVQLENAGKPSFCCTARYARSWHECFILLFGSCLKLLRLVVFNLSPSSRDPPHTHGICGTATHLARKKA
jgi:hypothetical protein